MCSAFDFDKPRIYSSDFLGLHCYPDSAVLCAVAQGKLPREGKFNPFSTLVIQSLFNVGVIRNLISCIFGLDATLIRI